VLEHVPDLSKTLSELLTLLRPGGQLLISGPTENIFYQIGRKIAGAEYSGDYHERGIEEIKRDAGRLARVSPIATLYWPVPLFEIFAVTV
jgi:2-polyprenyl-3-methyl-5-hydroxy-6-metoxy-1,4-benzoquinol methylase